MRQSYRLKRQIIQEKQVYTINVLLLTIIVYYYYITISYYFYNYYYCQLQLLLIHYRTSLQYGISCLKRLNYDRQQLEERRRMAEGANIDVLVWSNDRVIRWVQSIGLKVGWISSDILLQLIIHICEGKFMTIFS